MCFYWLLLINQGGREKMALSRVTYDGPVGLTPTDRVPMLLSILENSDFEQLSAMSTCLGDAIYFARIGALMICGRVFMLLSVDDFQCHDPLLHSGRSGSSIFGKILRSKKAQWHLTGKSKKQSLRKKRNYD